MKPPPIHMIAASPQIARLCVEVNMQDDARRLHYIDSPQQLAGRKDWLIYIHPTAPSHPQHRQIMQAIQRAGCIVARLDDSYARAVYNALQDLQWRPYFPGNS